jgi:uncharacterized protein YukE
MVMPHPTANPDELEALARRLRAEADVLERAVSQFDRAARGTHWQGRAATQFVSDADADQRSAHGLAGDLRNGAAALDAGASQIRQYLADLARQQQQQQQHRTPTRIQ